MAAATRSARLLVALVSESGALPNRCGTTPLSLNLARPPKVDKRIISGAGLRVIGTGGGPGAGPGPGQMQGQASAGLNGIEVIDEDARRWRGRGGWGGVGGGGAGGGGGAAEVGRMPDAGRGRVGDRVLREGEGEGDAV